MLIQARLFQTDMLRGQNITLEINQVYNDVTVSISPLSLQSQTHMLLQLLMAPVFSRLRKQIVQFFVMLTRSWTQALDR